jgi:hypothetical protein
MLAIAVTLVLFGFTVLALAAMVRAEGSKMLAAFEGHSWASRRSSPTMPVTLRFNPRYPESRAMRARLELRAAA